MLLDASEQKLQNEFKVGGRYAKYVLVVLVIVYIFNFIDRQILSILAEDIKADLGISDAEIGFLYGTAFAVFYAVFGLPLGRLADTWVRKSLISIGLLFWSAMTALSGTARSFQTLAIYRIGVGIGESSATPAAFSMLADYFPPQLRTTALSIYSSGVYIGSGIGIFLGGIILDSWHSAYPDALTAPLGLKGWHVAFFAVGLPGILMAIWVWTLREPIRGLSDGLITPAHPNPFAAAGTELTAMLPGPHFYRLWLLGGGLRALVINLIALTLISSLAIFLYQITGNPIQWTALGIGVFAAFSWAQSLRLRDPPTFHLLFNTFTLRCAVIGFPSMAFITYGIGFWSPPFFQRVHEVSASETGTILGLTAAIGGWSGVTLGGVLADKLRGWSPRAKLYVSLASVVLSAPTALALLTTDDLTTAYWLNAVFAVTSPMWVGPAAATVNELVLPRMRAIASAFYLMMVTFIGLALGPFTMGKISDFLYAGGLSTDKALTQGMTWGLSMYGLAAGCMLLAMLRVSEDQKTVASRAEQYGEPVGINT